MVLFQQYLISIEQIGIKLIENHQFLQAKNDKLKLLY